MKIFEIPQKDLIPVFGLIDADNTVFLASEVGETDKLHATPITKGYENVDELLQDYEIDPLLIIYLN